MSMKDKDIFIERYYNGDDFPILHGKECPNEIKRPIIKSFGRACRAVNTRYKLSIVDFIYEFLKSDIARTYQYDYTLYSQGDRCIAGKILDALNKDNIKPVDDDTTLADEEVAYWLGYLIMSWIYEDDCEPADLLKYDWERIYWGYDVLHTTSIKYTIEIIKEDMTK